nr:alpha/beta fold hydrolase [Chryseobacterium sp. SSA4.19]
MEGLEAVKLNEGTKNLIIAVRGWQGGNPDPGKTQVKNIGKDNFASTLVNAYSSQKDTQVAVFDASFNSRTPNDISESIKAFRELSPDGQLVLVGHSMGGDNIVNVANDNPDVKINKMVTLDISDYGVNDNKIPSNTDVAINYYQTETPIGGTKLEPTSNNSMSKIVNVKTSNTTHTTIDNDYRVNILNEVKTAIPQKNK